MRLLGAASVEDLLDAFVAAQGDVGGYPDAGLFRGFPDDCRWQWISLDHTELGRVHHIRNEPTWLSIAGPDRAPPVAVRWMQANPHDEAARTVRRFHARMLDGERPPPIVLVGPPDPEPDQLVVLEGNRRTVAACSGGVPVEELAFLLGTSPGIGGWWWYDDRPGRLAPVPVDDAG